MPDEEELEQDIMQKIDPEWFKETTYKDEVPEDLIHIIHNTYLDEASDDYLKYADLFCDNDNNFYLRQEGKEKENSRLMTYWYICINNEDMSKLCNEFGL